MFCNYLDKVYTIVVYALIRFIKKNYDLRKSLKDEKIRKLDSEKGSLCMKRGFITIATGDKHYYKLAANLLETYRFFAKNPLPFAIIAEKHNEYTEMFDDVIITNESKHSFMDKFLLFKLCPYDETIFIDADCLAYGDLNGWWKHFDGATDFSATGVNVGLEDNNGAWYNIDGIGKWAFGLKYKSRVHAGVMFFRKSEVLTHIYEECVAIANDWDNIEIQWRNSIDEGSFGIVMPRFCMKAIPEPPELLAYYPCFLECETSMFRPGIKFKADWCECDNSSLLHFGNYHTHEPLYRFDMQCFRLLQRYGNDNLSMVKHLLYKKRLKLPFMKFAWIPVEFCKKVSRKLHSKS